MYFCQLYWWYDYIAQPRRPIATTTAPTLPVMNDTTTLPFPAPLRVLLLDDDTFMLDLLADMLSDLGLDQVRTESNARSALASIAADAPTLLICDLSMPDMDGVDFIRAAAAAGYRGSVMLLSGMDSGVRLAAEQQAGVHGLHVLGAFQKPILPHQMGAALAPLMAA